MCRSVLAGAILAAAVTTMSAACANAQKFQAKFSGFEAYPGLQLVQNRSVEGPVTPKPPTAGRSALATPGVQLVQTFSGLGDFHTNVSANTWSFAGAYGLRPTNVADCYTTNRLIVGDGSVLLSVVFYVQNSGPSTSQALLLQVQPTTSTFALFISAQPAPNTPGIQAVSLDLGDGVLIQDAAVSTTLTWCPGASDGTQILYGAQVLYLTAQ